MKGLPPVLDAGTEILILGTFPSEMSLASGQYYSNPKNQFWQLLGLVFDRSLKKMDYGKRLDFLLAHRIGLWDVIGECDREGNADAEIQIAQPNDFTLLQRLTPMLRRFAFNGRGAESLARSFGLPPYQTLALASSSGAYAVKVNRKLESWSRLICKPPPR